MLVALLVSAPAWALSLSEVDRETLAPGVELVQYRSSSPATDIWAAEVDLCADGVRIDATRASSSPRTVGSWAGTMEPVLAVNGDFYRTGPLRVYGDAVGGGVPWPLDQTGRDPSAASEWFYGDFGWFAFGTDAVQFTHTGWTKDNAASLGVSGGWEPTTRSPDPPDHQHALVSGFPALVIEGAVQSCPDPTASSCFPDRTDMRARHPRTAMGLSADLQTLFLVVADGRSDRASGLYGSELAEVMDHLGAWQAINLDGGGSTTLWTAAHGTTNEPSDGSPRSVANHLGVFSGPPTGGSTRPWHCSSRPPCQVLGPGGGTLDEAGDCFQGFGPPAYLRELRSAGDGGSLVWTNQFTSAQPSNQARWVMHFAEAGTYELEWHGEDGYAVADSVTHRIVADGTTHVLSVDQSVGAGWHSLGRFDFAAGGDQHLTIEDNAAGSVPADQHIVFDAVRLTRVGEWCGDESCGSEEDCWSCPGDCPPGEELPGTGVDEDCDGEVDELEGRVDSGATVADSGSAAEPDDGPAVSQDDTGAQGRGAGAPGEAVEKGGCATDGGTAGRSGGGGLLLLGLLLGTRSRGRSSR